MAGARDDGFLFEDKRFHPFRRPRRPDSPNPNPMRYAPRPQDLKRCSTCNSLDVEVNGKDIYCKKCDKNPYAQ